MRFLFVGPGVCLQLPSDNASRLLPLLFGYQFPSSGSVEDLHLQEGAPCRAHQKKRAPSSWEPLFEKAKPFNSTFTAPKQPPKI